MGYKKYPVKVFLTSFKSFFEILIKEINFNTHVCMYVYIYKSQKITFKINKCDV